MSVNEREMTKPQLRKHFLQIRNELKEDFVKNTSIEIASRLLCTQAYTDCDLLLIYVSTGNEVCTTGIIHAAFANGKKVAVPYCNDNKTMDFYLINSMDDLKEGRYGILEPDVNKCKKAVVCDNCLCVVPALSFDAKGYRMGRGGGYYDKFLAGFKGVSAGLCYHSFLRLSLPREHHDKAVNMIVTENFVREIAPESIGGI